jgi:hypothetical protein
MEAPPENFAYTLLLSPDFSKPDALAVIDVKPGSPAFSQIVHTVTMPYKGDEFHHFGWNACSSALSPLTGHAFLERRYLIIPGLRSSRIYIVDTKPDPTKAKIHKIIEPEEVFKKTGYSRPHTVHCGPEGIYVSTLGGGGKDGTDGPPGVFIMDCETFDILGRWEIDRGPQKMHYDFWWNLPRDYMVTSEWGLPPQFENGIVPEDLKMVAPETNKSIFHQPVFLQVEPGNDLPAPGVVCVRGFARQPPLSPKGTLVTSSPRRTPDDEVRFRAGGSHSGADDFSACHSGQGSRPQDGPRCRCSDRAGPLRPLR